MVGLIALENKAIGKGQKVISTLNISKEKERREIQSKIKILLDFLPTKSMHHLLYFCISSICKNPL